MDKEPVTEKISATASDGKLKAEGEYAQFNRTQKITSDFDREVKSICEMSGENNE